MWGAIKNIPEVIRSWHDNRSQLYSLVAGVCAVLVAASWDSDRRPSDVLAWIARGIGASPVADWFGPDAPAMLEAQNPTVQKAALGAVMILLAVMVFAPLYRDLQEGAWARGAPRALLLPGSPSASTVWLLLLLAAQQGEIASVIRLWWQIGIPIVLGVGGILIVLSSIARHRERNAADIGDTVLLTRAVDISTRTLFGVGMTIFAILFAAVSTALAVLRWMCALQSDHSRELSDEIEREREERRAQPTGAVALPLSAGDWQ